MALTPKIVLKDTSPKEQYDLLYKLDVGQVFKIHPESNYETVMRRIEEFTPSDRDFEVFPINPGTSLYTMYGPSHSVVVLNKLKG